MANNANINPMLIDSTGVVRTERNLRIKAIRWVGATTAGHALILDDQDGNVVFHSVAAGANHVDAHNVETVVNGLTVDTIASGTCYVYLS